MKFFIEIFTTTKFHEFLHIYLLRWLIAAIVSKKNIISGPEIIKSGPDLITLSLGQR